MPQSKRTATKKSPAKAARNKVTAASPRPSKSRTAAASPVASPPPTRKAALIALLSRPEGAELSELVTASAWQVHSVRAALTHFRRAGHTVHRERDAKGVSHYHLKRA